MAEEDYHPRENTEATLDDLHRVARSIDGKVEEILDELRDFQRPTSEDYNGGYPWDECYQDSCE